MENIHTKPTRRVCTIPQQLQATECDIAEKVNHINAKNNLDPKIAIFITLKICVSVKQSKRFN
jgi:hypothetical protein